MSEIKWKEKSPFNLEGSFV